MQIRSRMSMSADGYVTTPSGWPALTADRAFVPAKSHGFPEFRQNLEAALMGRTTFEPALGNDFWPWLTPALSPDIGLAYESQRALPGGSVEIVYSVRGHRDPLPHQPTSQLLAG